LASDEAVLAGLHTNDRGDQRCVGHMGYTRHGDVGCRQGGAQGGLRHADATMAVALAAQARDGRAHLRLGNAPEVAFAAPA
jgi:hypothetical protein